MIIRILLCHFLLCGRAVVRRTCLPCGADMLVKDIRNQRIPIQRPDRTEQTAAAILLSNADNLIYVVKMRAGGYRWIGNENFRTNTNPAQDSGMNVTDASGTTLEVTLTDISPAPYFVGKLKTAAGTIDCSTGEIEAVPGA